MIASHATFSIVAEDASTGQLGIAIASKLPCVGSFCPVLRPGVGAAVTQAWTNPALPDRVLDRLANGGGVQEALDAVMSAEVDAALRQVAAVAMTGEAAAFTGDAVEPVCGHRTAPGLAVAGNMLPDADVLDVMVGRYRETPGPLAQRLLAALTAGAERGGDTRGTRSAALKVVTGEIFPLVDLRADDHDRPVAELRRLLEVVSGDLARFIAALPTRANPRGRFETVQDLRPEPASDLVRR